MYFINVLLKYTIVVNGYFNSASRNKQSVLNPFIIVFVDIMVSIVVFLIVNEIVKWYRTWNVIT